MIICQGGLTFSGFDTTNERFDPHEDNVERRCDSPSGGQRTSCTPHLNHVASSVTSTNQTPINHVSHTYQGSKSSGGEVRG